MVRSVIRLENKFEQKRNHSNWPVDNAEELAKELGCKTRALPTSYLGLPLGAKHKAVGV